MSFKPYVASASTTTPEFTARAVILGVILGLIFGIGNAYLGLKVGVTVSASIPAAVLSMSILRAFFRGVSILENNIVQTIASVGEGLAGGVIFTVPALFFLDDHPSPSRIFILASLGGILGVLFMIPMRRYIIVHEHGKLPFPEGTACAEILKSGESGKSKALMAITGIFVGLFYKICSSALFLWNEVPSWIIRPFQKTEFSMDCTPSLLGVGYIIGPRISSLVFAGGALGWWVLIPLITMFGIGDETVIYPSKFPLGEMNAEEIWSSYIRYIGAGTVACGGLFSLFKIFPMIWKTVHSSCSELFKGAARHARIRTDQDISLRWLILGSIAIILILWLVPTFSLNILTIILLAILGFFFVAVTSLTVGLVGSTSNPVSGMTITTLLITCGIFLLLGWTERVYLIAALTMSVVVNVAICLAGTTSQDLKTGYLLGATPRLQQLGEIIGVILPAAAIGATLYLLDQTYGFGSKQMPAPQGTMIALIAKGVMTGNIPTTLVLIGAVLGVILQLMHLPVLPFAIGLYLPLSLSTPVMVGGIIAAIVTKASRSHVPRERGILASSGLIAGDACTGVVIALLAFIGWIAPDKTALLPNWASLVCFTLLGLFLLYLSIKPPTPLRKN